MMFDSMCMAADACIPGLAKVLRYASLIDVPRGFEEPAGGLDIESEMRLPWKAVAIETVAALDGFEVPMSVVVERAGTVGHLASWQSLRFPGRGTGIVKDMDLPSPDDVFGQIDTSRRSSTADCGIESGDCFRWATTGRFPAASGTVDMTFWCGMMAAAGGGATARVMMNMSDCCLVEQFHGQQPAKRRFTDESASWHRSDFWRAIRLATLVSKPSNWIVKKMPTRAERRMAERSGSAPSFRRDRWLLITDRERERCFREPAASGSDRKSVAAHARRAHYRHIGENDDGTKKYTWVRACWVGSTEAEIRGQKYRVELEL